MNNSCEILGLRNLRLLGTFLLIAALCLVMPRNVEAYVMPAEELAGLMAVNFSRLKTMEITQSVHLLNPQDQELERVFEEKIWLKAPDLFHSEVIGGPGLHTATGNEMGAHPGCADMSYRRLFMANNSEMILEFLSEMGINLKAVAFTRFDGVIAYRLGDKGPESPKIVIEKERFLPLLLTYNLEGPSGFRMVNVRFDDYKKIDKGWYPYEIDYSGGNEILEQYLVLSMKVNVATASSLSRISVEKIGPFHRAEIDREDTLRQEHLREIIRILKEKYR